MLLQVAIPADDPLGYRLGADRLARHRCRPFVLALLAVGLSRALLTFVYRYGLYRMAFEIDTDLAGLALRPPEQLVVLLLRPNPVRAGHLRANSDIRSVQMFLVFGPIISMTMVMFVAAFAFMLSIHPLADPGRRPAPARGVPAWKQTPEDVFPLSWILQVPTAEVASIVDENINGVRVVRSFAAERAQIDRAGQSGDQAAVGRVSHGRGSRPTTTPSSRTCRGSARWGSGLRRVAGHRRPDHRGHVVCLLGLCAPAPGPVPHARPLPHASVQRARASAARIYEVLDEEPEVVDRPDAAHLPPPPRRGRVRRCELRLSTASTPSPCSDRFSGHDRSRRDCRPRRPDRLGEVDGCSGAGPVLRRRRVAPSPSTGTTFAM